MLEIARASDGRFGVIAERRQSVGEKPSKRRSEIDSNYDDASRAVDLSREFGHLVDVDRGSKPVQVVGLRLDAMPDLIGEASFLPRRSSHHRVRRYAGDKVTPKIGGKVGEFLVAQRLNRPDDGRRIDFVATGHLARR